MAQGSMFGGSQPQSGARGVLMVFALAVMVPNLLWLRVEPVPQNYFQEYFLQGLATIGLLISLSPRLWVGALLLAPWAILAPVESFYILDYGKPSDTHLIGILSDTNLIEASGFLTGVVVPIGVLGAAALALAVVSVY